MGKETVTTDSTDRYLTDKQRRNGIYHGKEMVTTDNTGRYFTEKLRRNGTCHGEGDGDDRQYRPLSYRETATQRDLSWGRRR